MKEGQLVAMVGHDNPACVPAFRAMRGVVKRAYPDGVIVAWYAGDPSNSSPLGTDVNPRKRSTIVEVEQ